LADAAKKEESRKSFGLRLFVELPRLDSNQDKESQNTLVVCPKCCKLSSCDDSSSQLPAVLPFSGVNNPDLQLLASSWPAISPELKAAILALARAATSKAREAA
jgi:hypothetical protein